MLARCDLALVIIELFPSLLESESSESFKHWIWSKSKMLVCTSVRSWSVGIVSGDYGFCRHGNKFSWTTEESLLLMNWICLQQLNIVNKDLFLFDRTNYYKRSGPRFISHVRGDVCWHENFRNLKNLSWWVSLVAAENNDLKERSAANIRYCPWLSGTRRNKKISKTLYRST